MRLVSHPNVVDLRAFFYSNGDKVGFFHLNTNTKIRADVICRKTRFTSISCWNMYPKLSIVRAATTQSSSSPCLCSKSNCTCTNFCAHSPTSTPSASVIETSSPRTCSSTQPQASSNCVISALLRSWSQESPMSATSARGTTVPRNSFLVQPTTPLTLASRATH